METQTDKYNDAPLWVKAFAWGAVMVFTPSRRLQRFRDRRSGALATNRATRDGFDSMLRPYKVGDLVEFNKRTNHTRVIK